MSSRRARKTWEIINPKNHLVTHKDAANMTFCIVTSHLNIGRAVKKPKTLKSLNKLLTQAFTPPRAPDVYRKSRDKSKKLAKQHSIEIQPMKPGHNVWPPKLLADSSADPFDGDHYANDWDEVCERVQKYAEILRGENNNAEVSAA
jgi:hypothetical protein